MTRKEELLDALLKECDSPEELLGENGLLSQLTKALVERALEGEMTNHLGALTTTLSDSGILSG